jgi:hypothetical protein
MRGWQLRKLFLLALLALPLAAANFAYVQGVGNPGAPLAFSANNTAGNIIVVELTGWGSAPTVSDTRGNTYTLVIAGSNVITYVATNIAAGPNTVSLTGGTCCTYASRNSMQLAEYSSANPNYCVAAGSQGNTGAISGGAFRSAGEAMPIIGLSSFNNSGGSPTFSIASGTMRIQTTILFFGITIAAGLADNDVASVPTAYSNTASSGAGIYGYTVIFLYLGGGGCGVTSSSFTFPILY